MWQLHVALFVAARGPDAFAAAPMTGAGLW